MSENLPAVLTPDQLAAMEQQRGMDIFHAPDNEGASWNTLDRDNPEHRFMLQEVRLQPSTTIDAWIGKTFTAVHAHICRWHTTDPESGEYITGLRVTLLSKTWEMLSFTGATPIRCLQTLAGIVGLPPWPTGLPIEVGQLALGGNPPRRTHTLKIPKEYFAAGAPTVKPSGRKT